MSDVMQGGSDQMFAAAGQVHPRPGAGPGEGREYDWLPDSRASAGPGLCPARPGPTSTLTGYTSLALYMTHGDWKEGTALQLTQTQNTK